MPRALPEQPPALPAERRGADPAVPTGRGEAQIETIQRLAAYQLDLERSQRKRKDAPEPPGTVSPSYGRCHSDAATAEHQCGADRDLCYQNCGGEITYTTHCVANCQ